jgi:hypothetical protein
MYSKILKKKSKSWSFAGRSISLFGDGLTGARRACRQTPAQGRWMAKPVIACAVHCSASSEKENDGLAFHTLSFLTPPGILNAFPGKLWTREHLLIAGPPYSGKAENDGLATNLKI